MIKTLWYRFCNYVSITMSQTWIKDEATSRYKVIFLRTRDANTLSELLYIRSEIKKLEKFLEIHRAGQWSQKFISDLTKYWGYKYIYWKQRGGGNINVKEKNYEDYQGAEESFKDGEES